MLNLVNFKELDALWGPHTIDYLPTGVIINSLVLMLVTTAQAQRPLMPLHVTGVMRIIGGVLPPTFA